MRCPQKEGDMPEPWSRPLNYSHPWPNVTRLNINKVLSEPNFSDFKNCVLSTTSLIRDTPTLKTSVSLAESKPVAHS